MRPREWFTAKKRLEKEYLEHDITRCERCGGDWGLTFHHLDKRSSGKAENTFEGTRLLCVVCHDLVEHNREENDKLRKMR